MMQQQSTIKGQIKTARQSNLTRLATNYCVCGTKSNLGPNLRRSSPVSQKRGTNTWWIGRCQSQRLFLHFLHCHGFGTSFFAEFGSYVMRLPESSNA